MENSFLIPISRQEFLKGAGQAGADASAVPDKTVKYADKDIPLLYAADVCVGGRGPAGTAAAINAARNGARTVLIERSTALGGLAVLGCVYPFMDTHAPDIPGKNEAMQVRHKAAVHFFASWNEDVCKAW